MTQISYYLLDIIGYSKCTWTILSLVNQQQFRWGWTACFWAVSPFRCLCAAVILIMESQAITKQEMSTELHTFLQGLEAHSSTFLPTFSCRVSASFSTWFPSIICDAVGKWQRKLPFACGWRGGKFQMTDSQVGMKDCQVLKRVLCLCIQAGASSCTLHSNKRFSLKTALLWVQHSFILRAQKLSIILIHPPDRSVVQVEVSVVLLFFLTKVAEEKMSLTNSLLVASSAHICWVGLMPSTGEFPATWLF